MLQANAVSCHLHFAVLGFCFGQEVDVFVLDNILIFLFRAKLPPPAQHCRDTGITDALIPNDLMAPASKLYPPLEDGGNPVSTCTRMGSATIGVNAPPARRTGSDAHP